MSIDKKTGREIDLPPVHKTLHCKLGRRDRSIPNVHYELLDENFHITKPTIICLGGNATLHDKDANAMCKIAERLIGLKAPSIDGEMATTKDVDILGITYGPTLNKYGKKLDTSSFNYQDVEVLVNQLLLPLVLEDGQKLPIEQACKNITNVTFLSHSMGTRETAKLTHKLANEMLGSGYNHDEVDTILQNITSVAFAPHITISTYNRFVNKTTFPNITQFNIKSLRDGTTFDDYEWETQKNSNDLHGLEFVKSPVCDQEFTLYSDEFNTQNRADEHMIGRVIYRDENWKNIAWYPNKSGEYVYNGFNADIASQCAGYILASAVANAIQNGQSDTFIPKPTVDELMVSCADISLQHPVSPPPEQ